MIRVDLICSDGSCINVDGIISVKEQIEVFIPESRSYRDLITFEKEIKSIDNLWDWKYKLIGKTVEQITIYGSHTNMETNEITENVAAEWKHVEYVFHGIYREIHEKNGTTSNNILLTIVSNRGTIKKNDPTDDDIKNNIENQNKKEADK